MKKSLVGYLAVSSKPAGAKVTLIAGGDRRTELGLTDFFPLEVLAGDYTVEVTKEGYKSETRTVSIAPAQPKALEVDLVRTLASTFFITEPAGVEVWVDGELRLTTAGTLAPDFYELARGQGPRALAGLGPHRDRQPLARLPHRGAPPPLLRDRAPHPPDPRWPRTTRSSPSRWRTRKGPAPHLRAARAERSS